jgi:hypothetical protein
VARYPVPRAPAFQSFTTRSPRHRAVRRSAPVVTGGCCHPTWDAALSMHGLGQEQSPPPPFCLLAILTPHSALTTTSLLAVVGHFRHTPLMSMPGICTAVASPSARARSQLKVPATEARLLSSLAASSSSWSSLSTIVPR